MEQQGEGENKGGCSPRENAVSLFVPSVSHITPSLQKDTATHTHTMPKRKASTKKKKAAKRRKLAAGEVLVEEEAAGNGDTTDVQEGLEKRTPDKGSKKKKKSSKRDRMFNVVDAARNGNKTAVLKGLKKCALSTKLAFYAVHDACRGNHDECLALLLPYVETTQLGFGMLLSECVHADHTACTEVLLQHWKSVCSNVAFVPHGLEEDSKGEAPRACPDAKAETPKADSEGEAPLACPAMWADPAVCQVLIAAGADTETRDDKGLLPLHWACKSGAPTVVKMLVEAGANVCGVTEYCPKRVRANRRGGKKGGNTCLMLAVLNGHTETVRYLAGLPEVDLNSQNNSGATSLRKAVFLKQSDVVQVLIDAGADIEAKGGEGHGGRTPLNCACVGENLAIVQMLVKAGANVSEVDAKGDRCLSVAASYGRTETVRYLLGLKEVDVNHRNLLGHTALDHAKEHQRTDVEQVLLDVFAQ